jgi:HNH endonuclease
MNEEERFWSKIDKREDWECWPWKDSTNDGYGQFWTGDTMVGAHRYAWELTRRCKVPSGKMILHRCDNRLCCNPNHLYCGDAAQNALDRMTRNNQPYETYYHNVKFYEGEIWLIRKLRHAVKKKIVAKMFKCHPITIQRIWNRQTFKCKEGYYI